LEYKVENFPVFHRYLAAMLLKIGLAEGDYFKVLDIVGQYTVKDYCHCGDEICSTVYMWSETLDGKDALLYYPFNMGIVIINFFPDGRFDVESLADSTAFNFPFRQELRDVFAGKKPDYDDVHAQEVVDAFMQRLKQEPLLQLKV